jgi:hypothetical protein
MSPYVSINVAANKAANQNLSDHAYKTLQALMDYADELGICWPGIRLLVNDTGKCKEMVQQGLEELVATGCIAYLRRNARDPYTGQKLVNIYQISPVLLHVRPELEAEAWKSWNKANGKEFALSYSGQDRTNTRTSANSTSASPNGQSQHQQTAEGWSANMGVEDDDAPPPPPPLAKPRRTRPAQKPPQTQAPESKSTHFSPMKLPYPDIAPVDNPLPDEHDEALAQRIRNDAQMPIKLARGLIVQYGRPLVEAAANHPFTQKAQRPAGYIRYLVQGNRLDPERDARFLTDHEMDVQKYISGKYADFVEH